jgi:hypothetical protein
LEEADRVIDAELARASDDHTKTVLGEDAPSAAELSTLRSAVDAGTRINVELPDFLVRAISLAGGTVSRHGALLAVPAVPTSWLGGKLAPQFEGLYTDFESAPKSAKSDEVLEHEHPLVQSAIRWIRQTRYSKDDDHRLAARLIDSIDQPDVIATFIAMIRAGDNTEMEQLIAVRVTADGSVDESDATDLLYKNGVGNVPPDRIPKLFGTWWTSAVELAQAAAVHQAGRWKSSVQQRRFAEQGEL